jgi:hypothetical protein
VVNGAFERGWLYKDSLNPIAQVNAAGVVEATYVYVTRANVPDYIVTTAGAVYRVVLLASTSADADPRPC